MPELPLPHPCQSVKSVVKLRRPVGDDAQAPGLYNRSAISWLVSFETDAPPGRFGRRREQRLQLRPDGTQRRIVLQQHFVNFRQSFEDRRVGRQLLAHLHERPHHKHAHGHGFRTVQNRRRHDCAVFGEGEGQFATATVGTGRILWRVRRNPLFLNDFQT